MEVDAGVQGVKCEEEEVVVDDFKVLLEFEEWDRVVVLPFFSSMCFQ